MGEETWLIPKWYLLTLLDPLREGWLTGFPAIGVLCLAAGLVLLTRWRRRKLLLFVIPFLLSEALLAIAGAPGRVGADAANLTVLAFLIVQAVLCLSLFWRLRGIWVTAGAFALFSLNYAFVCALFASFELGPRPL